MKEFKELKEKFRERLLKDILDYKEERINYLPSVTDYSKEFNTKVATLQNYFKLFLSDEDKILRKKVINSQTGHKNNLIRTTEDVLYRKKIKLMGQIGERLFLNKYRDEYGWVVMKLHSTTITDDGKVFQNIDYTKIKEIITETFDKDKSQKEISKLFDTLSRIKNLGCQLPDYLLFQKNKILFYEVKSYQNNKNSLNKLQRQGIEELRKEGYKVYINYYKIDVDNLTPDLMKIAQEVIRSNDNFKEKIDERLGVSPEILEKQEEQFQEYFQNNYGVWYEKQELKRLKLYDLVYSLTELIIIITVISIIFINFTNWFIKIGLSLSCLIASYFIEPLIDKTILKNFHRRLSELKNKFG